VRLRVFFLLCLWFPCLLSGQAHLEVRMLDVGQGDAVLLRHAGHAVLYDAGPVGSGVATRLWELGVDTLDLVIASHGHADHIGGMDRVFDSLVVRTFAWPGVDHGTQAYERLARAVVTEPDLSLLVLDSVGGISFEWLWPPADSTHWSLNDRSLGLRVCVAEGCVMLAGDAEEAAWERWAERYPELLEPVTVHKASHHGSRNGDTPEAIKLLSPRLVVISAGRDNRYGHPHQVTLDLYRSVGARVLRTDLHGEVIVELHADGSHRTWVEHAPEVIYLDRWWPRWPWGTR
jgi:competence protein ComEC